jgi:hypothetical protein
MLAAMYVCEDTWTYLWCHEFRSTTERACSRPVPHFFLAQTVICNLDVSVQCQQNVVELQISVDDAILMEVLESEANLCCVKPVSC